MENIIDTRENKNINKEILQRVERSEDFLLRGNFRLTKSKMSFGAARFKIERNVLDTSLRMFDKTSCKDEVLRNYQTFSMDGRKVVLPKHYPVSMTEREGVLNGNRNVFMYFPYCMGGMDANPDNHFSLEFIESSQAIYFNVVAPSLYEVFVNADEIDQKLSNKIKNLTYLFSLFHEIGHLIGPWQATPKRRDDLLIKPYYHAIMGELAADLMIARCNPEYLEISLMNLVGKMFFYARKGFMENPIQAMVNLDNDSWGGVFMIKSLLDQGVVTRSGDKYHMDLDKLMDGLIYQFNQVHELGLEVIKLKTKDEQMAFVESWMSAQLDYDDEKGYSIPKEIINIFNLLKHVPEQA
ncbi:hypothetical protein PSECIP111951_01764 [Pseudoalteromonas holothuriae]|uniref:Uncharacterized protein n=1 Tax=Pseudoalteromonas holothuriae TaxID=2963714 RepID=A0A9W4QYD8_9GAMM|nr:MULTISPECIES: hypothetical protein [unclassified Pseudoalteromonas]CAH9057913.1 hypothetical protein PSECIP111951_01764 [Pseudoalteromonas sp. CIP111951]CAH9058773.1 hypothetical protein PSECIP111854_02270 [Pseudoalteromonas sp. CIP111854]